MSEQTNVELGEKLWDMVVAANPTPEQALRQTVACVASVVACTTEPAWEFEESKALGDSIMDAIGRFLEARRSRPGEATRSMEGAAP